jgi:hypothetical protein
MPTEYDEAVQMIQDGRIHDGKTIATLLMYDRFVRTGAGAGGPSRG